MSDKPRDPLDVALDSLPRNVAPSRDLWIGISAGISESSSVNSSPRHSVTSSWMRLAAGVLLILASSITTYVITQRSAQQQVLQARQIAETQLQQAPALPAMPTSFGPEKLSAEYMQARAALDAEFRRQIATLPPVTRAKLERDLANLRRTASEISATLAQHPSHALLQDLLLSTYQSELALLSSVSNVNVPALNAPANETHL